MIRQDEWKFVYYHGYEPQLFNLADDPYEMEDLSHELAQTASEMATGLHEICDCQAVAKEVRQYNVDSFGRWRAEADPSEYEEAMSAFFQGWGPELKARIARWLGEG